MVLMSEEAFFSPILEVRALWGPPTQGLLPLTLGELGPEAETPSRLLNETGPPKLEPEEAGVHWITDPSTHMCAHRRN